MENFRLNTGLHSTHSFVRFVSIKYMVPWQNGHACFLRVFWSHNSVIMIPWVPHPFAANFDLNNLKNKNFETRTNTKVLLRENARGVPPALYPVRGICPARGWGTLTWSRPGGWGGVGHPGQSTPPYPLPSPPPLNWQTLPSLVLCTRAARNGPWRYFLFVLALQTVISAMIMISYRAVSRLTPGMSSSVGRKIPAAPWLVVSLKNLSANTVTTTPGIVCWQNKKKSLYLNTKWKNKVLNLTYLVKNIG